MSSIIGFLERVGCDSRLRHAGEEVLAQVLSDASFETMISRTLLCGDLAALQATLQVDRTLCCLIYAPLDDEEEDDDEREDDGAGDDGNTEPQEVPEDAPRQ